MRDRTWLSSRSQYRPFRQVADSYHLEFFASVDAQSDFTYLGSPATPTCHPLPPLCVNPSLAKHLENL